MEDIHSGIGLNRAGVAVPDGLQARDLAENTSDQTWKGQGASPGFAEGTVKVFTNQADLTDVAKDTIIVSQTASRELGPILSKVGGLITERGGVLALASGWAREQGIPAVVGVGKLLESLKDGDRIRVNGWEGTVQVLPG